jgi:hypothetical protein
MQPMLPDPVAGEKRPSATCRCVTGAGRFTSAAIRAVEFSPLHEAGRSSGLLPASSCGPPHRVRPSLEG